MVSEFADTLRYKHLRAASAGSLPTLHACRCNVGETLPEGIVIRFAK